MLLTAPAATAPAAGDLTFSDWIGVSGLVVTVLGFGLTIWQLVRTANASKATALAVKRTEKRMALNHLLILLPQLRITESELDHAVQTSDKTHAQRTLVAYSHLATEIAALLALDSDNSALVNTLRTSAQSASTAKGTLVARKNASLTSTVNTFQKELGAVLASVSAVTSTMRVEGTSDGSL